MLLGVHPVVHKTRSEGSQTTCSELSALILQEALRWEGLESSVDVPWIYEHDKVKATPDGSFFSDLMYRRSVTCGLFSKQTEQNSTTTISQAVAFCNKIQSKGTWYHTT